MIYLLRHGETHFNREGRLQGRLDSPLTDLGVAQARRMGRFLRGFLDDPDAVSLISSPLGRTLRTAELVREELGLGCEIEVDARIAEVHGGDWEGRTRAEILEAHPHLEPHGRLIFSITGAETRAELDARLKDWLAGIDETDGRRRIVVSHGAAGYRLRQLYAGSDAEAPTPPQDAVFLLHRGVVGRIDEGWDG